MARLQKSFEDYFKIPILLYPIGKTSPELVHGIQQTLSSQNNMFIIDQRYELLENQYNKILKNREANTIQKIMFRVDEFVNQWNQFEVIYRCRFVIGVYDSMIDNEEQDVTKVWQKTAKKWKEEGKKVVGLIISSTKIDLQFSIEDNFIIVPETIPMDDLWTFLQPWLYSILAKVQSDVCHLIKELQVQDNNFIVFNKQQQKPDPKTIKKKKRGRCLKVCGDFCLNLHLIDLAYKYYLQAEQILRKIDDFLWLLGCTQGKIACLTTDFQIQETDKSQIAIKLKQQSLQICNKIKHKAFETENYFKILKLFIDDQEKFDEMGTRFISEYLNSYGKTQKFNLLVQLARLYGLSGMKRKMNYLFYEASLLILKEKPEISLILLKQIKKSTLITEWPMISSQIIKLIINNDHQGGSGILYLELLQYCQKFLSERDVRVILEGLNYRNDEQIIKPAYCPFKIHAIQLIESKIKPKINKLSQRSPSPTKGFFMNWKKADKIMLYQRDEEIFFQLTIQNQMSFPLRVQFGLVFSNSEIQYQNVHLPEKTIRKVDIITKLPLGSFITKGINMRIWNFQYFLPSQSYGQFRLEIYEKYPKFTLQIAEPLIVQESSLFSFPFKISRTNPDLFLQCVRLSISVYYTEEVGFQQNQLFLKNIPEQVEYFVAVQGQESGLNHDNIFKIKPLKLDKKYLKKIELRLDALKTTESKYQISLTKTTRCTIINSLSCTLVNLTTPIKQKFPYLKEYDKIIEDFYIAEIQIKKNQYNLSPYELTDGNWSEILSEKTEVRVKMKLAKVKQNCKIVSIKIKWWNVTRIEQKGELLLEIPTIPLMFQSEKIVKWKVNQSLQNEKQQVASGDSLRIQYEIEGSQLSHSFLIKSLRVPSETRGIITRGKTKICTNSSQHKNSLNLRFYYQYEEHYIFGIEFQNGQIFWYPCLFQIQS